MSKPIFREYIGVKPSSKSLRDFPTQIINSDIEEFHFILGFASEEYDKRKKGNGVFKDTWNDQYFGPEEVKIMKEKYANVKVIISIGGCDSKTPFNPAVEQDKWIKAAVESLKVIILKYNDENRGNLIDGIDINYYDIKSSADRFSHYMGKVISTLKNDTTLRIKVVSIAPSEENISHYCNLSKMYTIDFVNYQFYNNFDVIATPDIFVDLYNKAVIDFSPAKVLPGFSTDSRDENNLPIDNFIAGCIQLIHKSPFHGVFLWNANESAITPFSETTTFFVEHVLQRLLYMHKGTPEQAIVQPENVDDPIESAEQRIIDGFNHFKLNNFNKNPDLYDQLAKGQSPKFLVFACSDSRVSPSIILNFQPGEAFIVRNIANMVPAFDQLRYGAVGSAIEYAITALKVENILVIGHSLCGGISRLMCHPEDDSIPFDFIDDWVKNGLPAKVNVLKNYQSYDFKQQCKFCEVESVNNSLVNLKTYPYVDREIKNNNLALFGGYYDFVTGEFKLWK